MRHPHVPRPKWYFLIRAKILSWGRPATEIYRHKTHLFEEAEQDSESRYGLREGVGQKEKGMLIQGQLRPHLPRGPKAWSALEAGVDKPQAHSHLRKKPRNKSKAISCKSINCSIWGATPMIQRMCQCCVFVNSITVNDTCYMLGSAQGVSVWGYPQELTALYKDKGTKQPSWHSRTSSSCCIRARGPVCLKKKGRQGRGALKGEARVSQITLSLKKIKIHLKNVFLFLKMQSFFFFHFEGFIARQHIKVPLKANRKWTLSTFSIVASKLCIWGKPMCSKPMSGVP